MSAVEKMLNVLLILGRACIGGAMIFAGVQLLRGDGLLSGSSYDSPMIGIFVIILGVYSLYSGVVVWFIDMFFPPDQGRG